MKKLLVLVLALCVLFCTAAVYADGKVMLYSSMQEDQLMAIEKAFEAKYPDIDMEYYFASGGKVMTKVNTEAQAGKIEGDVIWTGDPSDYEEFKKSGWLQPYTSPEADHIDNAYKDPDGYYTGGRLINVGLAWWSAGVDEADAPKSWNELLDPKWNNQIVMTDPAQASTTKYWMAAMMQNEKYGPAYFEGLRDNGIELESGTTSTHNAVAVGSYEVGVCLDYVSANLIAEGSPMAFHLTENDIVTITSPIGIFADSQNVENAHKLVDFLLSKEGQELLVANNLVSVRDDVDMNIDAEALVANNLPVDIADLAENTSNYLAKFNEIFGK
jgi:iron(III) transport system substrate-binding protein